MNIFRMVEGERLPNGGQNCSNMITPTSALNRRKLFSSSSLQLNLNCVQRTEDRERRREPLLRPLNEAEDSYIQMISARTPLIEPDSDRESCV